MTIVLPTRWLAGNYEYLAEHGFGCADMCECVDLMDKACAKIVKNGKKIMVDDFMFRHLVGQIVVLLFLFVYCAQMKVVHCLYLSLMTLFKVLCNNIFFKRGLLVLYICSRWHSRERSCFDPAYFQGRPRIVAELAQRDGKHVPR